MSATQSPPITPAVTTADAVRDLGPWFHNLHLPDGAQTAPNHQFGDFPAFKWREIAPHVPQDLTGWSCLDIGCNAGFYSFELARRGANVLGIDLDDRYLRQAQWAAGQFNLADRVRFERRQVYDLAHSAERFDLVLFLGVLYHLRYPMLGLDIVTQKVRRLLVFQTLTAPGDEVFEQTWGRDFADRDLTRDPGWPRMVFFEHGFAGDYTNWWAPTHAGVEAMLRAAGMRVLSRPAHEFYLCAPSPERPSAVATWNAAELKSATGQPY
jgi:tRNA (mo5U34)-methyltransferase